ncbi:hypothetical protein RintRC_6302 [Richelia intracellularis]|nr:hypothetical protein RintRC_6302 [Richelia intracellularis]
MLVGFVTVVGRIIPWYWRKFLICALIVGAGVATLGYL